MVYIQKLLIVYNAYKLKIVLIFHVSSKFLLHKSEAGLLHEINEVV